MDFNKPIVSSDYRIGDWIGSIIILSFLGAGLLFYWNVGTQSVKIILTSIIVVGASVSMSMYYLTRSDFYLDRIESKNFLFNSSRKKIFIVEVVGVEYVFRGGIGTSGNGTVTVFYKTDKDWYQKQHRCLMDNATAAKLFITLKTQNISLSVDPLGILNRYGYS